MREFEYVAPKTVKEALNLLATYKEKATILAGGTDVVVRLRDEIIDPEFIIDIKHIDEEEHVKLTGKTGKNIIEMFRYLDEIQKPIWIRHVLVPGITDNDEYLEKTRDFIRTLSNVQRVEILPYHGLAITKYKAMGLDYVLKDVESPSEERVANARKILECEKYDGWRK